MMSKQNDPVNHPSHYTSDPSGVECIEITRHLNFNVGNAVKYAFRAGKKDLTGDARASEIQDLKKAIWYLRDSMANGEQYMTLPPEVAKLVLLVAATRTGHLKHFFRAIHLAFADRFVEPGEIKYALEQMIYFLTWQIETLEGRRR